MLKAKFKKGQKVDLFGNEATITSVKFNVFTNEFIYSVKYFVTNEYNERMRFGQSGLNEYELKAI